MGFRGGACVVQGRTEEEPQLPLSSPETVSKSAVYLVLNSASRRNEFPISASQDPHRIEVILHAVPGQGDRCCKVQHGPFGGCETPQRTLGTDTGPVTQAARRDSPWAPRSLWKVKTQKDQKRS